MKKHWVRKDQWQKSHICSTAIRGMTHEKTLCGKLVVDLYSGGDRNACKACEKIWNSHQKGEA
jgi:hypothetical protein